jgi:hypothetical protein
MLVMSTGAELRRALSRHQRFDFRVDVGSLVACFPTTPTVSSSSSTSSRSGSSQSNMLVVSFGQLRVATVLDSVASSSSSHPAAASLALTESRDDGAALLVSDSVSKLLPLLESTFDKYTLSLTGVSVCLAAAVSQTPGRMPYNEATALYVAVAKAVAVLCACAPRRWQC